VNQNLSPKPQAATRYHRSGERRAIRIPGRLTWRDAGGALRFVSVVTRDMSDVDAFVECQVPASIPLYRLVHLQIEKSARTTAELPRALQQGKVLTAVYRVGPASRPQVRPKDTPCACSSSRSHPRLCTAANGRRQLSSPPRARHRARPAS